MAFLLRCIVCISLGVTAVLLGVSLFADLFSSQWEWYRAFYDFTGCFSPLPLIPLLLGTSGFVSFAHMFRANDWVQTLYMLTGIYYATCLVLYLEPGPFGYIDLMDPGPWSYVYGVALVSSGLVLFSSIRLR